jgi:predicted transcriptional regulator
MRIVGLRGDVIRPRPQPEAYVALTSEELALLKSRRGRGEKRRLAHDLNISLRSLTKYEAGERRPPLDVFKRWCELVGVQLDLGEDKEAAQ